MDKKRQLDRLNNRMSKCSSCTINCGSLRVVPGDGNPEAEIMFIGEAPGKKEGETGIPFVGSSGKILDKMLDEIKIKRDDVYLTNIIKCRPPENRDPLLEEVAECLPWIEKQIEIISPKIIVTLGKFALNVFLPEKKISEVHGKLTQINFSKIGKLKIFPIHHPAAARQNRATRSLFHEDFQKIPTILKKLKKEQ